MEENNLKISLALYIRLEFTCQEFWKILNDCVFQLDELHENYLLQQKMREGNVI